MVWVTYKAEHFTGKTVEELLSWLDTFWKDNWRLITCYEDKWIFEKSIEIIVVGEKIQKEVLSC